MILQMICSDTGRKSGAIPRGWGDAFEPCCLSRSSSSVCGTSANGAMFNGKRHNLFAAQMLIGPLRFGFSRFSGGTGEKKAERRLEREGAH